MVAVVRVAVSNVAVVFLLLIDVFCAVVVAVLLYFSISLGRNKHVLPLILSCRES